MEMRERKALQIAATTKLTRKGDTWTVPSQAGTKKKYTVDPNPQTPHCTCPDFEARGVRCKHIFAVEIVIKREYVDDGEVQTLTETLTVKKTYSQDWPAYNKAQTVEKDEFQKLLHDLCGNVEEPVQTFGRPRLPLADIIFAAAFKTYSTVSGRRFVSDLRDAKAKGYLSKMPSYNSIFDYLKMESLTPHLKELIAQSSLPLKSIEKDFAVDSSGFSTTRFVRWFDVKLQTRNELALARLAKGRYAWIDAEQLLSIAKQRNDEKVQTKTRLRGGWNVSTLSRVLKDEMELPRFRNRIGAGSDRTKTLGPD